MRSIRRASGFVQTPHYGSGEPVALAIVGGVAPQRRQSSDVLRGRYRYWAQLEIRFAERRTCPPREDNGAAGCLLQRHGDRRGGVCPSCWVLRFVSGVKRCSRATR